MRRDGCQGSSPTTRRAGHVGTARGERPDTRTYVAKDSIVARERRVKAVKGRAIVAIIATIDADARPRLSRRTAVVALATVLPSRKAGS